MDSPLALFVVKVQVVVIHPRCSTRRAFHPIHTTQLNLPPNNSRPSRRRIPCGAPIDSTAASAPSNPTCRLSYHTMTCISPIPHAVSISRAARRSHVQPTSPTRETGCEYPTIAPSCPRSRWRSRNRSICSNRNTTLRNHAQVRLTSRAAV